MTNYFDRRDAQYSKQNKISKNQNKISRNTNAFLEDPPPGHINDPAALFKIARQYANGQGVSKDHTQAVRHYKWAAEMGHAEAQYNLALCYQSGLGVTIDLAEAAKWYCKAGNNGITEARFNLGTLLHDSKEFGKNYVDAFYWWLRAANKGHVEAQYNVARCYQNGLGVAIDLVQALKWYREAANRGHVEAAKWCNKPGDHEQLEAHFNLGRIFHAGTGVEQDDIQAFASWKMAADGGHVAAQYSLGLAYQNGWGVPQNFTEAFRWFKLAADQGHSDAQFELGEMYEMGKGVRANNPEAFRWYKLAAAQGHPDALFAIAAIYELGIEDQQDIYDIEDQRDLHEVLRLYRLAAENGHAEAQNRMGDFYEEGLIVEQSYSEALRWYKLAADQDDADAQSNIGNLYEHGLGVSKNLRKAIRWFKLAAQNGEPYAKGALARLQGSQPNHVPPVHIQQSQASSQPRVSKQLQASNESLDCLLSELNAMTGLANVKSEIYQLIQYARVQKMRSSHGLQSDDISLHSVFTGSPGTGKTTVARLYGQMLKELGFLSKGHLVETDRTGLVAGYIGQTELKTDEKIREALGGILFIDEAYSLFKGDDAHWDFGQEVISVLLKRMEDHRDDLVVIVAGYPAPMHNFLDSNEGLRSRFSNFIHFDDYSPAELLSILEYFCNKSNYRMTSNAVAKGSVVITQAYNARDQRFGNARYVRNLFESIRKNQSVRIAETFTNPTLQQLTEILPDDIVS